MTDNSDELSLFYLKRNIVQRNMLERRSLRIHMSEMLGFYKRVI